MASSLPTLFYSAGSLGCGEAGWAVEHCGGAVGGWRNSICSWEPLICTANRPLEERPTAGSQPDACREVECVTRQPSHTRARAHTRARIHTHSAPSSFPGTRRADTGTGLVVIAVWGAAVFRAPEGGQRRTPAGRAALSGPAARGPNCTDKPRCSYLSKLWVPPSPFAFPPPPLTSLSFFF